MTVMPVNRAVDKKKSNRKKWRAEEEERHKGVADTKNSPVDKNSPNLGSML
jgi:hypothetical protein